MGTFHRYQTSNKCSFSVVFMLVREDTVYPNFAYWENCEFYPTLAYTETLVLSTRVVQAYCSVSLYMM